LGKAVNNDSNMLGKDLLNSGRLSREELKMVREEWQNLASAAGGPILNQTGQAIQQSQKQIEQYRKYIEKTVADIVGAFRKDFSIVGAIEHAGAEGEQELRGYLFAQLNTSGRFVEGIQELMRRGLNAETLMEIAMAGPNAAANAIDVLLGKNSEAVIEMVNNATNAMREMRLKLAIEADLIAKAAADPFKAKDMAAAMEMAPIITFLGEAATKERIAQAMGITPEEAGRIATEFGWTLASSIPPALETALNAQMPAVQDHFRLSMQTLVQSTGLTEAQVGEMFVTLIQGGEKAAKELVRTFGLPEHELKLVIDVIDYLARHKITDFGEAVDKLPTHHEVKLATDFGLSLSQLREYKTMWDNLNDKTITLRQYLEIAGMRVADQANIAAMGAAKGGIIKSFARGGEHHVAQMAKGGTWRLWAEPETGGEAYIPLHHGRPTKRDLAILDRVATMFGYATVPMDRGGFYDVRPGRMQSAAGSVVNVSSTVVFSGNIAGHEEFARIARNVVDRRDREVSIALSRKG
jgi:hypothetical protein